MAPHSRWLGRWSWLLVLGSLVAARPAAANAEGPKAARWIGADAALYFELLHPEVLLDRAFDERFQTLLHAAPGYDKFFKSEDYRKLRDVVTVVTGALDTTPEKGLRDLTGGGIILAVAADAGQKPQAVLVVTPKDAGFLDRAHAKLLELARQDAANKGTPDPVKQGEYRGITGFSVGGEEAHAILEGTLVIANGEAALHKVIDRALDGKRAGDGIADDPTWKTRRDALPADATAWGLARLDHLRTADPTRFKIPDQVDAGATFLFGHWIESVRKASWVSASLTWTTNRLAADVTLPTPAGGYSDSWKRYVPPQGTGAPPPIQLPGTIACLGLWRDVSAIWEVRADLFSPETVQNLNKLDSFAGQFFGGRDFGTGVLGALAGNWQLVVAQQDYEGMDPVPDLKLPAFALVVDLKPDDDDFAQRLKVAFQSFVGLVNLGAAESKSKAPPLTLGSETVDGITISTSRFMPSKAPRPKGEPVDPRHNFSPSVGQVGDHFFLSSSVGLARDLAKALKAPRKPTDSTVAAEVNQAELAKLVERNRPRLVMQNMVEKGNDKAAAETEIELLAKLLRYLGRGTLSAQDTPEAFQLRVNFALDSK